MQIDWVQTNKTTILCHGSDRGPGLASGPVALRHGEEVLTQHVHRIRSAKAAQFDRGNMLHRIEFRVHALYATEVEAFAAHYTHRAALARQGTLVLRFQPGTKRIEYEDALLEITGRERTGLSIAWGYKITAPTIKEY